ncbi:MAG: hypothetical protein JXR68_04220 [Bacteroidales bacterium]|nr:hypothetical protein [Bacteroidales bacterium]
MNSFLLIITIYLILSLLLNIIGPLSKKINSEFKKIDNQMLSEQVLKGPKKNIKAKFIRAKIILRLLTIIFFPLFIIVLLISKKQENKQIKKQEQQKINLTNKDWTKLKGLFFTSISGFGEIECNDCAYSEKIFAFTHSGNSSKTGYQCQDCGNFQKVFFLKNNKMEKLPECENCGGTLARDKILFCPNCKSNNLAYRLNYMT